MISQALRGGDGSFAVGWREVTGAMVRASSSAVWISPTSMAVISSGTQVVQGRLQPTFDHNGGPDGVFVDLPVDASQPQQPVGSIFSQDQTASQDDHWVDLTLTHIDLTAALRATLTFGGHIEYDAVINAIHTAPTAQRQASLADHTLRQAILDRGGPNNGLAVIAALLEGSLRWANPPNDFTEKFLNDPVGGLPLAASANYAGLGVYAAYLAGLIDQQWIEQVKSSARASTEPRAKWWSNLGWSANLHLYPGRTPQPGQLLFYRNPANPNYPLPWHVAISLGGDQAISLHEVPNNIVPVQRININDLPGPVHIGDPPRLGGTERARVLGLTSQPVVQGSGSRSDGVPADPVRSDPRPAGAAWSVDDLDRLQE